MYSIFLREHSRTLPHLKLLRSMGGWPRTFSGGLNKWQWKCLHEKKAKEKEKKLLDQEKQLYQARIRSQIRSNSTQPDPNQQNYTPKDHVKALADRFIKEGADGPLKTPTPQPQTITSHSFGDPVHVQKLIFDRKNLATNFSNFSKPRFYSVATRSKSRSRFNFRSEETSSSEDDSDLEGVNAKKMMSSAALGNYDKKIKKRIPLKFLEDEDDLSQHVAAIRTEFNKRISAAEENKNEESILSEKRFDECNVSPFTVNALTDAGYLQMTTIQEATLAACLEASGN